MLHPRGWLTLVTCLWTFAIVTAIIVFRGDAVAHQLDFTGEVIAGAVAWLDLVSRGSPIPITAGLSLLLGPFWACVLAHDFRLNSVAALVLVGCGGESSWLVYGSIFHLGAAIGGLCAPGLVVIFLLSFLLAQAKDFVRSLAQETKRPL